ncbi:MAG: DMT family transporter [Phycisphaerae bacterium]|nr:DMT family transporter [Phycisphaerae bacterium]
MLQYLRNYVPDGFTANMIRYPVASLFYLPLLIDGIIHRRGGKFWLTALLPAAINIAAQTFWGMAPYHHMDAGVISFLLRLSAIWGVLGAFLVFPDERRLARSPIFWAGTTIALGGFVIMSWAHVLGVRESGLAGLVIMFFCGLFQGLYGVAVRYVMGKLNPLFVFAVVGSYTSIGLIIMAPLGNPASLLRLPMMPWIMLLVSAVVGIGLAHGMYYVAVQRMGAAVSTLLLSVTPFVTICGSSILLNERFSPAQWIGGTILVLGATIAVRAPRNVLEITHANDSSTTEPADPHPTA